MKRVDCPACGGDGWLDNQIPHPMRTQDGNNDCRYCDGRGWIEKKDGTMKSPQKGSTMADMITVPVTTRYPDGTVTHTSFEMEAPQGEPIDDDFWCECGNPSEHANYHPDEVEDGERVSKHHWTCADCGRVTQVG